MQLIPLPVLLGVEEVRGDGCQLAPAAAGSVNYRASPAREMLTQGSLQGSLHLLVAPPAKRAHRPRLPGAAGLPRSPASATPKGPSGQPTALPAISSARQGRGELALARSPESEPV